MDIKVGDQYGLIPSLIPDAINYAVENGANVINLSFGDMKENSDIKLAIEKA